MNFRIKRLILEKGAENHVFALRAVDRVRGVCPVKSDGDLASQGNDEFDPDKQTLRLVSFPGRMLKPCPGTRDYLCCGYQILNIGTNCPLDCSYCILQSYFNQPSLRVFVNIEQQFEELGKTLLGNSGKKVIRIGTGEFTDSLALDPIVRWTRILPAFAAKHENTILEFKTKTVAIEGLLSSIYRDRIVVSWSLNSPSIAATEEHGAPSIRRRLEAARICQREGYTIGFHFDPLIEIESWREEYSRTLDMLDHYVNPSKVIWVSLGCLRYMPSLKRVIRRKFPGTKILDGEFVPGMDGKMRYIKPVRMEMYAFMNEKLNRWGIMNGVYLCMESSDVWLKAIGWTPGSSDGLSDYLDRRAVTVFGLS